ncbi:MAG TPA: prepilin-type N-terminal cleavage/methylation domain-containing protein [Rhodocyclaceae bacterium]|nr:prepilin-type N-terminal cleavage/methylation domain-containing protein [Rhodocyclaceae bacterium]
MYLTKPKMQNGFTLVEIAIVLVIIGLLIGGVLKGQELIHSAKVKNLINELRATSTFVYAYQDRFRRLPGDDVSANLHVGGSVASSPTGNIGNGRINGPWNSNNVGDESYLFWQHVRLANLTAGGSSTGNPDYLPRNADGGQIGITGDRVLTNSHWPASFYVCTSGVSGRYARQVDESLDDGHTGSGTVRVLGSSAGGELSSAATAYEVTVADDAVLYTLCVAS